MIAKVIPARAGGRGFTTLVNYVTAEQRLARPEGRDFEQLVHYVGRETSVDPATGEVIAKAIAIETHRIRSLTTAADEMDDVARGCSRLRAPADYHLVISWPEGETPTNEQAFEAGRHALAALKMAEHQYVMAIHDDTGNRHLHIAVNRVNPDTLRAVSPFRDYLILDRAMREMELAQGWSHDRGPFVVHGDRVRLEFKAQTHGLGLDEPAPTSQKAKDFQAWMGAEPFTVYVRRIAEPLRELLAKETVTWAEIHAVFAQFGTELQPKGTGLIVVDAHDPRTVAKASQVARFASRDRLEARLGPFEPAAERTLTFASSGIDDFRDYVKLKAGPAVRAVLSGREPSWEDVERTLLRYGLGLRPRGERFVVFDRDDPSRRVMSSVMGRWATPLGLRRAIGVAYDPERARIHAEWLLAKPERALAELTKARSTFTQRQLEDWAELTSADDTQAEALQIAALEHPELVGLGYDGRGRARFTAREMFAIERRMVGYAERLSTTGGFAVDARLVAGIADRAELTDEGRAALKELTADSRLAAVYGLAGVGKSTLLGPAREAWEAAGLRVRGVALSGLAAEQLEHSSGIPSQTLASALLGWQDAYTRETLADPSAAPLPAGPVRNALSARDVVVLDEANLVGSRQMERLLEHALVAGAKVVMIGDVEQLQAIDAGGAFRALVSRFGSASLMQVVRQRDEWQRSATEMLGHARTREALQLYDAHGRIHGYDRIENAKQEMLSQWERDRAHGGTSILLASTREDVRELGEKVRASRRELGELGADVAIDTSRGPRAFATEDRIRFLRSDRDLDVKNGSLGTILGISPRALRVAVDGKRTITVDLLAYNAIDWGYAATVHAAEGVTVNRAYVLFTPHADRHTTYVALSRHRDGVEAYWSTQDFADRDELERMLSRAGLKDTTLDYGEYAPLSAPHVEPTPPHPRHEREVPQHPPTHAPVKPRETYRRDPDLREERRQEHASERERLVAEYRAQSLGGVKAAWELQRRREQERRTDLAFTQRAERERLVAKGVSLMVADALVSVRFAGASDKLEEAISTERAELQQTIATQPRLTWREFLIARRDNGDAAAERALRGLRYRKERLMEQEPATLEVGEDLGSLTSPNAGADRTIPPVVEQDQAKEPEIAGAPPTRLVYWTLENGDVAYGFRNDPLRRALFHDRGRELVMKQNSDDAARAAVRVAREKWGNAITLSGTDEFKERALKWAVAMNVQVTNAELGQRQADLRKTVTISQHARHRTIEQELSGERKREIDLNL